MTSDRLMFPFSQRARAMPRSSIRRLFNAAQELESRGHRVMRLDIGDPDFPLPRRIIEGIDEALLGGETHYSPMSGIPELRQAIARHLQQRKGLNCTAEEIVVCQGATQGLNASLLSVCDPGTGILLPQIYWPNYMQQIHLGGIVPYFYPLDRSFQPRLEWFDRPPPDGVRALLVNSPGNPTGALFGPGTMRCIYQYAGRHDLWIISDEAYTDYVFEGDPLSLLELDRQRPPEQRRVIGVFSFSKSFAATGLRMGWTVMPHAQAAETMAFLNEPLTGSLTTPLQWGMVKALEQDDTHLRRDAVRPLRDAALRILREAGVPVQPPQGGLFVFMDISGTGLSGDEFADRLLREQQVAVVPGSGFGLVPADGRGFQADPLADRCVRACFAVSREVLEAGLNRLGSFYRSLTSQQSIGGKGCST